MRGASKIKLLSSAALLVAALLAFGDDARAQDAPQVAMRVGQHGNYTRVVFDFPKLTAYYANAENGDISLIFDTPSEISTSSSKSNLILGIKKEKAEDSAQKILIDIPEGATFKHYRLLRKIVIDIEAAGTKTATAVPPQETAAATPQETPTPPQELAKAEAIPSAPVEVELPKEELPAATSLTQEELKSTAPEPQVIVDKVEEKPADTASAEPEETLPAEDDPTKITISSVEPANLAVFTRFGTLWIVMDTKAAGAISPDIKGPQSGLLGKPKTLKFDGGIAHRYAMPQDSFLSVTKKSLTWEVSITKTKKQQLTNTQLTIAFDDTTRKAKLMVELKGAGKVLEIEDPVAGDTLYIVPTSSQEARIDQARRFPDIEILPASIGMAVRPLKDGIKVNRIESFVMITSPNGIDATPGASSGPVLLDDTASIGDKDKSRLFDFPNWRQGGIAKLNENRRAVESRLASAKSPSDRSEILMKLALLYFANNFGQETLGVLRLIEAEDEEMLKNPNFVAVRGAAAALAGHYQDALKDLSSPALQQHPEVTLWIGYAAAATEQWHMANRSFPKDNYYLVEYPQNIAIPFTIYMAESALRLGNTETARNLLHSLDTMSGAGSGTSSNSEAEPHYQAAISYLKGEAARQDGEFKEAITHWIPVAHGLDRLYHAKASLALATLQLQEKKITLKQAIETLDSLRFAWRGDGLEVQIMTALGQLKIQNRQVLAGLQDLKSAAVMSVSLQNDPKPIDDDISRHVYDLFGSDGAKDLSPLEAVSIYNEFEKYLPGGTEGATAALHFADYLLRMDLLEKAATLLEEQLLSGLPDERVADVGAKLAATYLLDDRPSEAITALGKTGSVSGSSKTQMERGLLKARAQSQLNLTDDAIATLSPLASDDAKRLKADVLWRARKWASAGEAIESLLPPADQKIDADAARLIVNAAVAWKLAGDGAKLRDLRVRYQKSMATTALGPTFGVVTRDSDDVSLSDRETILKIAGEVDMFAGFLDNYKSSSGKGS